MIKKLDISNLDDLINIENICFSHPLASNMLENALLNHKYCFFGYTIDDKVIAYGSLFIVADEAQINNIAVLPSFRKKGIATKILNEIINYSKKCKCSVITLEVRESNTNAIQLYQKSGFVTLRARKKYYNHPTEDAYEMSKNIGENS